MGNAVTWIDDVMYCLWNYMAQSWVLAFNAVRLGLGIGLGGLDRLPVTWPGLASIPPQVATETHTGAWWDWSEDTSFYRDENNQTKISRAGLPNHWRLSGRSCWNNLNFSNVTSGNYTNDLSFRWLFRKLEKNVCMWRWKGVYPPHGHHPFQSYLSPLALTSCSPPSLSTPTYIVCVH